MLYSSLILSSRMHVVTQKKSLFAYDILNKEKTSTHDSLTIDEKESFKTKTSLIQFRNHNPICPVNWESETPKHLKF